MIDEKRLVDTFLELVQIDSPSGHEDAIAEVLADKLSKLGLTVRRDDTGNVLGSLNGQGEPVLLSAHMDTVEPGRGVKPQVKDGVITSDGTTVLGGDDKSGVAAILEVLQALKDGGEQHRPLEVAFSVSEETGLTGAKGLDVSRLRAKVGIVLDSGGAIGTIVRQAPAQDSFRIVVHGKASHAGAEPEKGINAILVAAEAITKMPLGRIDEETTANIGKISGGIATNIIADRVEMAGEARSRDGKKLDKQSRKMVDALQKAAAKHGAKVDIQVTRSYDAYKLPDNHPWIQHLVRICEKLGITALLMPSGGGSDSNIFNAKGIQTVALSTGMSNVHTTEERIAVVDMVAAARLVEAIVTS